MIKKILNLITTRSAALALTMAIAACTALVFSASAQNIIPGSSAERGQQVMNQMMGANYNVMDEFMDQMMGANGAQSMYEMMGKINATGLTATDTKPIGDLLTACRAQATGNYGYRGMMGDWNWNGTSRTSMWLGGIFMLAFWVVIVVVGIMLFYWLTNPRKTSTGTSGKAMEILKEKYAKGEITKKEFETKKRDIM